MGASVQSPLNPFDKISAEEAVRRKEAGKVSGAVIV